MNHMNTEALLKTYFLEKNSSISTQRTYIRTVKKFEEHVGKKLHEIINLSEQEENIKWQKTTLYHYLLSFRKHLYDTLQPSTAQLHFTIIKTILRYFDVNIQQLQSFSTTKYHKVELTPEDIITQNELKSCVNVKNPLLKAIATFMSSSGLSLSDALNLTILDYINSTKEYHKLLIDDGNIMEILQVLNTLDDVVPVFEKLNRQKTGVQYSTFSSPESVHSINNYLIYRQKKEFESNERYNKKHRTSNIYPGLRLDDPLFDANIGSIERMFREVNDAIGLGKAGNYVKFAPHMMRRYHTSQLYDGGLTEHEINLLQGRKSQDVIHKSYLRIKLSVLRDKYIQALPYIVLDDSYRVRTELDIEKEKNLNLKTQIQEKEKVLSEYESMFENINVRLSKLEEKRESNFNINAFDELL